MLLPQRLIGAANLCAVPVLGIHRTSSPPPLGLLDGCQMAAARWATQSWASCVPVAKSFAVRNMQLLRCSGLQT